jgi:hypothetical protein
MCVGSPFPIGAPPKSKEILCVILILLRLQSLSYYYYYYFFPPFFWVGNFTQMPKMKIFLLHIIYSLLFFGENFNQIPKKISSIFFHHIPKIFWVLFSQFCDVDEVVIIYNTI